MGQSKVEGRKYEYPECIAPLFTIYTPLTLPSPQHKVHGTNVSYADDVTQVIGYQGKSLNAPQRRPTNSISRLNEYERKWRINENKFAILRLSAKTTEDMQTLTRTYTQQKSREKHWDCTLQKQDALNTLHKEGNMQTQR